MSTIKLSLIITADDFGYDENRNRGIVECFRHSAISRSSLLVNGFASDEAARLAKAHNIPLGLHLNLTEGIPVCTASEVKSLLTENGHFRGKFGFREALKRGDICLEEVKTEIKAQIIKYKKLMDGQSPRYVDGHQHIHVLQGVCESLAKVLSLEGIESVRLPNELGLDNCSWLPETAVEFYKSVSAQSTEAANCFSSYGIKYPDSFVGMSCMGIYMTIERLQEKILQCLQFHTNKHTTIPRGSSGAPSTEMTCELMVHPGYRCTNVEQGGCGTGADEFSTSSDREHEMQVLCSKEMQDFYKKFNIQLSS